MTPEFKLLGLRPREARVEVIRQALHDTAVDAKAAGTQSADVQVESAEGDQRLAEIATAGYHLLDPRRRQSLFERVQLLLWSEEELDMVAAAGWEISQPVRQPRVVARAVARVVPPPVPAELTVSSDSEEAQAALEVFRSLRKRDRQATALWASVIGIAVSLVVALTIFGLLQ